MMIDLNLAVSSQPLEVCAKTVPLFSPLTHTHPIKTLIPPEVLFELNFLRQEIALATNCIPFTPCACSSPLSSLKKGP